MLGLELIGVRAGLRGLGPWWAILSGLKSRPQQGLFFSKLLHANKICSYQLHTLSLLNLPSILSTSSLMDKGCSFTVMSC